MQGHNLSNLKFGRLLAIECIGKRGNSQHRFWKCVCDCGNICAIDQYKLLSGHTRSCGCYRSQVQKSNVEEMAKRKREADGLAAWKKLVNVYKQSARKRGYAWELTESECIELFQKNCFYCGCAPSLTIGNRRRIPDTFIYNGIDRVDNDIHYIKSNVITCCKTCNVAKASLSQDEFFDWVERIHKQHSCLHAEEDLHSW